MYVIAVAALIAGLRSLGGSQLAVTITLALGALHLFYDGLIWRSPRAADATASGPSARGTTP